MSPGPWTDQAPLSRWLATTEERGQLLHQQGPGCFLFAESVAFRNHYGAIVSREEEGTSNFPAKKSKAKGMYVYIDR